MGYGDEVMATGLARGAAARGKRIAFGDGISLLWSQHCAEVFRHNPNIATSIGGCDVEWIGHHRGKRLNILGAKDGRYVWNYNFKASPGEFYFDANEEVLGTYRGGILIEPNVEWQKSVAPNKDWGFAKYQAVADKLREAGHTIWQLSHGLNRLKGAHVIQAKTYRAMASSLRSVDLVICPEGGVSHAAGAVGAPGVVVFGGFPSPQITGYAIHVNLTGGVEACGSYVPCQHCADAMRRIAIEEVVAAADELLA